MSERGLRNQWQLLLTWLYALVLGFIFMLAGFGTDSWQATVIYFLGTAIFGTFLFILKYVILKDRSAIFGFIKNAPLYAYSLGMFLVPVVYVLAQGVALFTNGSFSTSNLVPEIFTPFFSLAGLTAILPGNVGVYVQEIGLQLGDVGPAEEFFKVAVIAGIVAIISAKIGLKAFSKMQVAFSFLILTLVNALWTWLHGIVTYRAASDFWTAFIAGEVILSPTWMFGNLMPGILTHGTWNTLGIFELLNTWIMIIMASVFGPLTLLLYWKRKR